MESIKELRKICQNPKEYHNPGSVWDNKIWRPFSIYLTKLLLYTPLKPDHVTFLMIFWGFLVGFLFSIGTYWYMLIGAIVFEFFFILDAVDGEMARYKKMSSPGGVFLDLVAHLINHSIPFVGISIGLYSSNPNPYIILAGFSAGLFSLLCLTVQALKHNVMFRRLIEQSRQTNRTKLTRIHKEGLTNQGLRAKKSFLRSLFKLINYLPHQAYLTQVVFLGAILGKLDWVLLLYSIVFPLVWIVKLIYEYKTSYDIYDYLIWPYNTRGNIRKPPR